MNRETKSLDVIPHNRSFNPSLKNASVTLPTAARSGAQDAGSSCPYWIFSIRMIALFELILTSSLVKVQRPQIKENIRPAKGMIQNKKFGLLGNDKMDENMSTRPGRAACCNDVKPLLNAVVVTLTEEVLVKEIWIDNDKT